MTAPSAPLCRRIDAAVVARVGAALDQIASARLGARLRAVDFAGAEAWEALRPELAEMLYAAHFADEARRCGIRVAPFGEADDVGTFAARVRRNVTKAELGAGFWSGTLDASFAPVGAAVEALRHRVRARAGLSDGGAGALDAAAPIVVAGFVSTTGPHMLRELLPRIEAASGAPLALRHDDVFSRQARALRRLGLRSVDVDRVVSPAARARAVRAARDVAAILAGADDAACGDVASVSSVTSVSPSRAAIAAAARVALSGARLRRAAVHAAALDAWLGRAPARIVVVPDERLLTARSVALIAEARGASVVAFADPVDVVLRRAPLFGRTIARAAFVFAAWARDFLLRGGAAASIGVHPRSPSSGGARPRGEAARRWRAGLGIADDEALVLVATQARSSDRAVVALAVRAAARVHGARVVVRPHPVQSLALVRRLYPDAIVARDVTPEDALAAADVVVTHSSWMAVDAATAEIPAILCAPVPELVPLVLAGAAAWAPDEDALVAALGAALGPERAAVAADQRKFRASARAVGSGDAWPTPRAIGLSWDDR